MGIVIINGSNSENGTKVFSVKITTSRPPIENNT